MYMYVNAYTANTLLYMYVHIYMYTHFHTQTHAHTRTHVYRMCVFTLPLSCSLPHCSSLTTHTDDGRIVYSGKLTRNHTLNLLNNVQSLLLHVRVLCAQVLIIHSLVYSPE